MIHPVRDKTPKASADPIDIRSISNGVHIAIGTKAQFIKMAPIMQKLEEKNIEFNLVDLGQHTLITKELRSEFNLKEPNVYLSDNEVISSLTQGLIWMVKLITLGLNAGSIRKKIFLDKKGICLIHGDTISTLLALYLAKRSGLKVAHVEAGLRSFNYLEPFPEEILRVIVMRASDILFAPSNWALENLKKMNLERKAVLLSANTSLESTFYSLNKKIELELVLEKFALITVHRMENIFLKKRLKFIIDLIQQISHCLPVVFVQHAPTVNQLRKFGLESTLNKINNLYFFKILSHAHFIHLVNKCEFVITDGGSIQEESYYLDKPCLLLRNFTEREEGIDENVILSKFSTSRIDFFLKNYKNLKRKSKLKFDLKPSQEIVDYILKNYL